MGAYLSPFWKSFFYLQLMSQTCRIPHSWRTHAFPSRDGVTVWVARANQMIRPRGWVLRHPHSIFLLLRGPLRLRRRRLLCQASQPSLLALPLVTVRQHRVPVVRPRPQGLAMEHAQWRSRVLELWWQGVHFLFPCFCSLLWAVGDNVSNLLSVDVIQFLSLLNFNVHHWHVILS